MTGQRGARPRARKTSRSDSSASRRTPEERTVRITVDLPETLHRALRVRVALEGTDAQHLIRGELERLLARDLASLRRMR